SVYEGLQLPMDAALRVESRYFAHILKGQVAHAMIRTLFVSMQALNKGARRPPNEPATTIKRIGVIGAGFMGSGIATVAALAGIEVVLIDRDQSSADRGKANADKVMTNNVAKGRATESEREAFLARITPTEDFGLLKNVDLVVEAVFEDPSVKAETIQKAEAAMPSSVVFASNTSTLPISELAHHFSRPVDFIGIHFFSPVDRMQLVEIIVGKQTGSKALAMAFDFVRKIGKTPIVVNDARGFFANRCVLNYLLEGHLMLQEGVPPAMIENAARMAGMPVGPLALSDEIAIDLIYKILKATKAALGPHAVNQVQESILNSMVENHHRLGRKSGGGFYDYPKDAPKRLWTGLTEFQSKQLDPETISVSDLKHRLLVTQALEAARSIEEGIVTDPREADVGAILGFGFAPYTGGPISMIDGIGPNRFVALCEALANQYGDRFLPNALLKKMAAAGEQFYS
ncbi:MAG: 3-hydroxyacyl-CoA dehydrogenase, partial [Alphaproteobacteria bacterium]|nr:3-hydroxyacyl-CoA dehydrogenase [Alphaproteobacteria bacterium]